MMIRLTESQLDRTTDRAAALWVRRLWPAIIRGYRQAGDAGALTGEHWTTLTDWLKRAMMAGHLVGRLKGLRTVGPRLRGPKARFATTPYDPALEFVKTRAKLTETQLLELEALYSPEAVRVVTGAQAHLNGALGRVVAQATTDGVHVREGIARLVAKQGMGKALAETVFRTQTQVAMMAGRLALNADPDIDEIIWGYQYDAVRDSRTRPTHAALHGTRLPKDHPRWREIMPPNGFNCRCTVVEIFQDEVQRKHDKMPPGVVEIDGARVIPGADKGFDFNPGDLFRDTLVVAT